MLIAAAYHALEALLVSIEWFSSQHEGTNACSKLQPSFTWCSDRLQRVLAIAGMHVNDSKADLGSKRDRHENIGRGMIGIGLFERLMNDPRLDGEYCHSHISTCHCCQVLRLPLQEKQPDQQMNGFSRLKACVQSCRHPLDHGDSKPVTRAKA